MVVFEQDDPFAELARLIGPRDGEPPRDAPYAPETADDLTDELLREFESLSVSCPSIHRTSGAACACVAFRAGP